MKLYKLIDSLDYPCTININILNENFKDIPYPFYKGIDYPIKYKTVAKTLYDFLDYIECEVVLFEEITINREYRIDVY